MASASGCVGEQGDRDIEVEGDTDIEVKGDGVDEGHGETIFSLRQGDILSARLFRLARTSMPDL